MGEIAFHPGVGAFNLIIKVWYHSNRKTVYCNYTFPGTGHKLMYCTVYSVQIQQKKVLNTGLGIRSFDFQANRSFFVKKWANEQFTQKNERFTQSLIFVSEMSDSLISLISSERSEQIAHDLSFPLSDLSDSLTGAHLFWAIWANCSQSLIWFEQNEQMSKRANEQIPSPGKIL